MSTNEPKKGRTVVKAEAEVGRLHQLEATLTARLTTKTDELAAAGAATDEAVLAAVTSAEDFTNEAADAVAGEVTATADRVGRLRAEVEVTSRIIDTIRDLRATAMRTAWTARAADLHADAVRLEVKADKEDEWVRQTLAPIEARAGVPFEPKPIWPAQSGPGLPMVPTFQLTTADRLRQDAAAREAEAHELETRQVVRQGAITAGQAVATVAELVALVTDDPWRIGPRVDALRAWATAEEAKALASRAESGERRPLVFTVVWRDGKILPAESSVKVAPDLRFAPGRVYA